MCDSELSGFHTFDNIATEISYNGRLGWKWLFPENNFFKLTGNSSVITNHTKNLRINRTTGNICRGILSCTTWLYRYCGICNCSKKGFLVVTLKFGLLVVMTTAQVVPWCSGYHYGTTSFNLSLNSGSAQVQILLVACQRFAMVRISDNGPGWK